LKSNAFSPSQPFKALLDRVGNIEQTALLGNRLCASRICHSGYVVEALTVLGRKPKLGKSWWAYDASMAIATRRDSAAKARASSAFGPPAAIVVSAD
jgi:hypothetical protein